MRPAMQQRRSLTCVFCLLAVVQAVSGVSLHLRHRDALSRQSQYLQQQSTAAAAASAQIAAAAESSITLTQGQQHLPHHHPDPAERQEDNQQQQQQQPPWTVFHTTPSMLPRELQPQYVRDAEQQGGDGGGGGATARGDRSRSKAPWRWNWKEGLAAGDECAARTLPSVSPQAPGSDLVGVVVAVCNEDLSLLEGLSCQGTWYTVYSYCQRSAQLVTSSLPAELAKCASVSRTEGFVYTQTYLKYINDRYDKLPSQTLFVSLAGLERSGVSLLEAVTQAQEAPQDSIPAFKTLGGTKTRMDMKAFSELCYAVQRYSCIRACSHSVMPHARQFIKYTGDSPFLVTRDRIRSLQRAEYRWLRDFAARAAQAAGPTETPQLFNAMEGLWGPVLGCPQDSGSSNHPGCQTLQFFGKGSSNQPLLQGVARWLPSSRLALPQEVALRSGPGADPVVKPGMPKIGIALVFCEEELDFINEVGCNNVVYHLFSKCGTTQKEVEVMAPRVAGCIKTFKAVPITLETELAWPKHHAQYLEHIIQRYDSLEPWTIFCKANLEKRRLNLREMVREIIDSKWAFYSFGNPKIKVNMTSFPETGNVPVWQREICAMYRRYTGADPCQMDGDLMKEIKFDPYYYNTRSMWAASNKRLRSLPVSEYQWMREYLMSVTFENRVKRRYVPERIWQAMLGCPAEIRTRNMIGCTAQQMHPSGQAVEPPGVFVADALVSWPQLSASSFSPDAPYPSFFRTHNSTKVTFVGSYVGSMDQEMQIMLSSVFVAAAKLHPDCNFVMLTDQTTSDDFFLPNMWLGRLEVRRYDIDIPDLQALYNPPETAGDIISFFQAHGVDPEERPLPDWKNDVRLQKWISTFTAVRLQLETCFLRDAMASVQKGHYGHLALMDLTAFFTRNLAPALDTPEEWHAGLPVRGVPGLEAATSVWFVHRDQITEAYAMAAVAAQMELPPPKTGSAFEGEGHLDLHSRAFSKVLQCCLPPGSLPGGSGGAQGRGPMMCDLEACGAKRAPEVRVRLLPCSAHLATMGGSFAEECPMSYDSPEDTFALKWGFREFTSEVYGLFKVKDKSTAYVSVKASIKDFITMYADQHPELTQRYQALITRLLDP